MSYSEDVVELFHAIVLRAGLLSNNDITLEQKLREMMTLQNAKSHRPVVYTTAKARANMASQIKELKTKSTQRNKSQQKLQPIFNKLKQAKTVNLRTMSDVVSFSTDELLYNSPTFPDVDNFKKENGHFTNKATEDAVTKKKFNKKTFGNSVITKDEEVQILNHLLSLLRKNKGPKEMERKMLDDLWSRKTNATKASNKERRSDSKGAKMQPRKHARDISKKLSESKEQVCIAQEPLGRSEVVGHTINTNPLKEVAKKNSDTIPKIVVQHYMECNCKLKTIPPPPPTRNESDLRDVYLRHGYQTSSTNEIAQNVQFKLPQIREKQTCRITPSFFRESSASFQHGEGLNHEGRNGRAKEIRKTNEFQVGAKESSLYPSHHLSAELSTQRGSLPLTDLSKSKAKRELYVPSHTKKVSFNNVDVYPRLLTSRNDFDEQNLPKTRMLSKKRQQFLSPPLRGFTPYPDDHEMSPFSLENDNF